MVNFSPFPGVPNGLVPFSYTYHQNAVFTVPNGCAWVNVSGQGTAARQGVRVPILLWKGYGTLGGGFVRLYTEATAPYSFDGTTISDFTQGWQAYCTWLNTAGPGPRWAPLYGPMYPVPTIAKYGQSNGGYAPFNMGDGRQAWAGGNDTGDPFLYQGIENMHNFIPGPYGTPPSPIDNLAYQNFVWVIVGTCKLAVIPHSISTPFGRWWGIENYDSPPPPIPDSAFYSLDFGTSPIFWNTYINKVLIVDPRPYLYPPGAEAYMRATGQPPNVPSNGILWRGNAGQNATGFGYTFYGGGFTEGTPDDLYLGTVEPWDVTVHNNITVSRGQTYPLVIPQSTYSASGWITVSGLKFP